MALDFTSVYKCSIEGHVLSENIVEQVDGVISGYCENCGDRISMLRVPGGITSQRIKGLINTIAEEDWKDFTALLLEHAYLKKALQSDEAAHRECRTLLEIAGILLQERLGDS